jgi:hypothetical protein
MKRLLLFAPLFILAGCDLRDSTTPANRGAQTSVAHLQSVERETSSKDARSTTTSPTDPSGGAGTTEETDQRTRPPEREEAKDEPPEEAPPIPETYKALNKEKTIFLEVPKEGPRRVHLLAEVCLREGLLEVFLCKTNTKEHESVLHVNADGREIHAALVLANAQPGHPVKFTPKFEAPNGTVIKISLTYREKGKVKSCPANEWVKDRKTSKYLTHDWVFAGSRLLNDPEHPERPPYYTANQGEFICLSNFADAMLDLPVKSSKEAAELAFEINTPRIPPLLTPVIVTLEPVVDKKK